MTNPGSQQTSQNAVSGGILRTMCGGQAVPASDRAADHGFPRVGAGDAG